MIYFITSDDLPDYPIKIGYSDDRNVNSRPSGLQTGNPHKLFILGTKPGDWSREWMWHKVFESDRIEGGEWFRRSQRLMSAIENVEEAEINQLATKMREARPPKKSRVIKPRAVMINESFLSSLRDEAA